MLQRFDDCKGRWACSADPETGLVEHKYKNVRISCHIQVGEEFTIRRDDTITVLKRTAPDVIQSNSYILSA